MESMKSNSRRAALIATYGTFALSRMPLHMRLDIGYGYQRGDQFYKYLPMKRVKGKWSVKR